MRGRRAPLLPDAERWGENRLGTSPARHACWQTPAPLREVLAFYRALPITTPAGPATLGSDQGASTSAAAPAGRRPSTSPTTPVRPAPAARRAPYGGGLTVGSCFRKVGRAPPPRGLPGPRPRLAQARGLPGGADEAHAELARRLRTDPRPPAWAPRRTEHRRGGRTSRPRTPRGAGRALAGYR